ncbi:hypothetical protein H4F99_09665 [Lysobacter sp. SG-8]|uniref:DUF4279 domain-containing protein n=1 Tax=Marilutibacter penaei TaxID=2759900 RepID=A0A7W3YF31_9GAMM|nr:hypothetical protein [Lysobacter penaei]MBB1088757.1 hypothetical protein [Lysobacter penaei]
MTERRYRVALRATHPRADLAPLFNRLGLHPSRHWRAGEPRARGGVHGDSYATAPLDTAGTAGREAVDLAQQLRLELDRLAPHQPLLQALVAEGGRCELAISLPADPGYGFDLGPWLCEAVARLRLSLSFDIQPAPSGRLP